MLGNCAGTLVEAMEIIFSNGLSITPDCFSKLRNSALSDNLIIFKDPLNRPIGYIAIAMINKESARRLLKYGRSPVFAYEWHEGGICLVLDVMMTRAFSHNGLHQLKKYIQKKRAVIYSKKNKTRVYLKKSSNLSKIN